MLTACLPFNCIQYYTTQHTQRQVPFLPAAERGKVVGICRPLPQGSHVSQCGYTEPHVVVLAKVVNVLSCLSEGILEGNFSPFGQQSARGCVRLQMKRSACWIQETLGHVS
jgi:hypothetical protein